MFVSETELLGHGRRRLREHCLRIAAAALRAVDPGELVRRRVVRDGDWLLVDGEKYELTNRRVWVVGAGKATIGMAAVLDELLGDRIADGAVVVKRGQGRQLRFIEVLEASHPVPDEDSLKGGERLLEIARRASADDLVLALVTGGSSSLAVVPAPGVSLTDKVATNRVLLSSGADIQSMNDVRKHISCIKGGRLGAACGCPIVNLTVSDVVGNHLDYVTDLTVADRSTFADAQAVCDAYSLWEQLPSTVSEWLRRADEAYETAKSLPNVQTLVVADPEMMCAAAAEEARRLGYEASVLTTDLQGEASDAGRWLVGELTASPAPSALIAGGENTVNLNGVRFGEVAGGPNQEAALTAAIEMDGAVRESCILCLDSDGTDGPTSAAGGLVDDLSAASAREREFDLAEALRQHRSADALTALGDLVVTGSTGTNVNDLKIALTSG